MDTDLRETMRRTIIMKKENSIPVRNSLLLLLTATIWGVAFVAQSVSMDYIGGFTFNAVRNLIGALTRSLKYLTKHVPKQKKSVNLPHPGVKHCSSEESAVVSCSVLQAIFSSLVLNTLPSERPVLLLHVTSSLFRSSVFS